MTSDETTQTGEVWALIQQWMDSMPYPPSQRQLAGTLGVSPTTVTDWKYKRGFPSPENLERLAKEIGVPVERVLDGVLIDHGYRERRDDRKRGAS